MYIEPNTTIKLYSGIPLDNSYKNTLYFANISAQSSYFHGGISKYTLTRQSYQRVERGRMRVELLADNIYDCNYLAFQNENFGNKWFYAFITGVEYVSNNTSEITFEIDVMQTWYFDYELLDSFVDREHTDDDTIGANLVEENLELGEYIVNGSIETIGYDEFYAVVCVSEVWDSNTNRWRMALPTVISGTPQCVNYFCYNIDGSGMDGLQMLLNGYVNDNKMDAILGVFLLPKKAFPVGASDSAPIQSFNSAMTVTKVLTKQYGSFDGYTPRNNKLYTYPYNYLYVTNMSGNSAIYPYEYFDTAYCEFRSTILASTNCEAILEPREYKISSGYNRDENITLKGFPQCAFAGDAFRAWLAQNSGSNIAGISQNLGMIGGAFAGLSAGASPLIAGGLAMAGITGVINKLGRVQDAYKQPPQTKGVDNSTIMSAKGYLDFTFMNKRIRGEFARIIDDFFTMYGYKTNRVKTPNIHVRQRWTYTKTIGCNVKGECPVTHLKKIIEIYDNGITFWVNPSEVGNYALSNPTI